MERNYLLNFDPSQVSSPSYVIDMDALERNLQILSRIQNESGAKILLALKGFATVKTFDIIKKHLKGVCASSVDEAQLGFEYFGKEVHTYSPAYKETDFEKVLKYSNHVIFNSLNQWEKYKSTALGKVECGLRINPEHSETDTPIYDPCSPNSRLGIRRELLENFDSEGITGLHMHTLCQKGADSLARTLSIVEDKFGHLLHKMKWFNFGGGHFLTHPDYDIELLIELIKNFQHKYNLQVYLEPGESVVWKTGVLVATVLDIIPGDTPNAILDISVTCHMPDVLEMPYRADIEGASEEGVYPYNYNLGGGSCLAGDVAGIYSFQEPLSIGQQIEFMDMSQYTMVKTSTFNGIRLPSVVLVSGAGKKIETIQTFGYDSFRDRLITDLVKK